MPALITESQRTCRKLTLRADEGSEAFSAKGSDGCPTSMSPISRMIEGQDETRPSFGPLLDNTAPEAEAKTQATIGPICSCLTTERGQQQGQETMSVHYLEKT